MRVLYLTAGTGSFYCGSCMRDNAIVRRLRGAGHDVHLMPLYMPLTLDESDATDCPLFLGGINSWLQQKSGLFRVTPRFIDALFDWKPLLKFGAQMTDMTTAAEHGDMAVSTLEGLQGRQRKEIGRMLRWVQKNLSVDVVCLSNLLLAGLGVELKRALKVPVVSAMQGEDGYLDALGREQSLRAWDLLRSHAREIDALLGISCFYARHMEERLKLPAGTIRLAENGIDLDGYVPPASRPQPPVWGFFAHITPSKGLHSVVDAFIKIRRDERCAAWRLAIGGSCTKADEKYLNEQLAKLKAAGLDGAVTVRTNLSKEDKQAFYRDISVLTVAPTYPEPFGLYTVEAVASGTPLLLPDRGALGEIIAATGAGIAVPVTTDPSEDAYALSAALTDHLSEPGGLEALQQRALAGRTVVAERYSLAAMTDRVLAVFEDVVKKAGKG